MTRFALLCAAALVAAPAAAEVSAAQNGFVVTHRATVKAPPAQVWDALVTPSRYWHAGHSYSGDAANFTMDARAGGCFCETLAGGGSVEHMRVVMVQPGKLLRLHGGLGPLQAEGLAGALTWTLKPVAGGTEVTHEYVVGGFMRFPVASISKAVDAVQKVQFDRLVAAASTPPE